MKLLIAFLKDKTREISLYAGTVGIFIVVAFLYNIRMDALKYALLLVILWLLLYVITEYHRFRKKHLLLERFKKSTQGAQKNFQSAGIFWNWIIRNYWGSLMKRFWS